MTGLKAFLNSHARLLGIGLITAAVIIGFQVVGQLVIYRYLKLDYYLSLVAVAFLAAGFLLNKRSKQTKTFAYQQDLLSLLTSKEFLVLRLLAEGKTNKEIAVAHSVEVSTIKTHVNNIYAKLSVNNRAQARARYAEIADKLPIS